LAAGDSGVITRIGGGPGLLVTIDGPGGAGKSTVAELVAERLRAVPLTVVATAEPSRTDLGNFVRQGADTYRGHTLACLVAADRHHHLQVEVRPALESGAVVICDRYVASSLVLQRLDGVDEATIWDLARHVETPDLAVIISARPSTLASRIAARGAHSRFETDPRTCELEVDLYSTAAQALRARGVRVIALDSSAAAPDVIADQVVEQIRTLLDDSEASSGGVRRREG
jgi:dTMP kinase